MVISSAFEGVQTVHGDRRLMSIRGIAKGLVAAAIIAHAMPALASGKDVSAQAVFDAFLGCGPEFFSVLSREGNAFGVHAVASPAPDLAGEGMTETATVTFAAPIDVNGIQLLKYSQMKAAGPPDALWWGFVTDRTPQGLVDAVRLRDPAATFIAQGNAMFRVIEEGNGRDGTASARTMMINATGSPGQSLVLCIVTLDLMGDIVSLPDAKQMFGR
ncbi:hypothetical protein ASE71_31410 [Ensifer sp. Root954]|nr:hypothetical protein ASD49_34120 [Ensifer sp. Root1298]KQX78114.1 hypothetical protein ASD41_34250 [Ensifer sp. Root1312]KRC18528.1 hypothetical protein ASE29_04895 [Ensifer sp. Root74]KRD63468.1 hypothetical protein ASE71_31410 [Ensifer sp. Root954]